jgi:GNAT superfamily N-acetyltransferase
MKIIKSKKQDAKEISLLRINTNKKILSKYYSKKVIKYILNKNTPEYIIKKMKEGSMFCAWNDGKLVGTITLQGDKICGVYVKSNIIGKGIGTKMMDFIERLAKRNGIKTVRLYPSKFAMDFYKHRGYKITKRSIWSTKSFSIVSYMMKKRLN